MPTAEELAESTRLLVDLGRTDSTLDLARQIGDINNLIADRQRTTTGATRDQLRAQQAADDERARAEQVEQAATTLARKTYESLDLTPDQAFASRLSGELDAVMLFRLQRDLDKSVERDLRAGEGVSDRTAALQRAISGVQENAAQFISEQQAQGNPVTPYTSITPERAADLSSEDGFLGNIAKGAATALAGIPGLLGIGASALGAERAGQFLGGVAADIRNAPGTDIGSSAAGQLASEIVNRAGSGDLGLGEAARQLAGLSLTDGDFAADLLASTVGAAAGGGLVGGVARAGARAAGSTASLGTGAAANAVRATPAIGVGLGAGVDENLTTEQARILAGTAGASALTAGVAGALGGQVAETALGNLGRRVNPRIDTSPAAQTAAGLPRTGLRGQLGAGARSAGGTAVAEAVQEGVEGAGEALGGIAQQTGRSGLDLLSDPATRAEALRQGAVQAPLGGLVGAPLGAATGVADVRAQNAVNRAQERSNRQALDAQRQEARTLIAQEAEGARLAEGLSPPRRVGPTVINAGAASEPEAIALNEQFDAAAADRQAEQVAVEERDARVEARRSSLVNEIALTPAEQAQVPIGQPVPSSRSVPVTLTQVRDTLSDVDNTLVPIFSQPAEDVRDTLRALYRNQVEVDPLQFTLQGEDAFVDSFDVDTIQSIPRNDPSLVARVRASLNEGASRAAEASAVQPESVPPEVLADQARPVRDDTEAVRNEVRGQVSPTLQNGAASQGAEVELSLSRQPVQQDVDREEDTSRPEALRENRTQADEARARTLSSEGLAESAPAGAALDGTPVSRLPLVDDAGTAFTEQGRDRLQQLSRQGSELFAGIPAAERRRIFGNRAGKRNKAAINELLAKEGPLTPEDIASLDTAVDYFQSRLQETSPEALPGASREESPQGIALGALFNETGGQLVLSERGRQRAEALSRGAGSAYADLTPAERASLQRTPAVANAQRALTRLLSSPGPVTEAQAEQVRQSVSTLERAIAGKKPDAPADGGTDPATSNIRASRLAAPRSAGAERTPPVSGLLPGETDVTRPRQFSSSDVQAIVSQVTGRWKRQPRIEVVATFDALPQRVRDQLPAPVQGVSDGRTAYLVADALASESMVIDTLHEELFHAGIRKSLGGDYETELRRVFRARGGVDGLLALAREYRAPTDFVPTYRDIIARAQAGDRDAQVELTDEVLARVAQSPDLPSGIRAAVTRVGARIRRYLRQFMPERFFDAVTDSDLLLLMAEARAAGTGDAITAVRASRGRGGDFRSRDPATGRVVVRRLDTDESRPVSPDAADVVQATKSYFTDALQSARQDRAGQSWFRSERWQRWMKRLADARFDLARMDNEYRLMDSPAVARVFAGVRQLELPPLLEGIVNTLSTENLQRNALSLHAAASLYASRANELAKRGLSVNERGDALLQVMQRMTDSYGQYAAIMGVNPTAAKQDISRYLNALHARERNDIAYIKNVPLADKDATAERDQLRASFDEGGGGRAALDRMRELADKFAAEERETFRGAGMTDAEAEFIIGEMTRDADQRTALEQAAQATYGVIAATTDIRRQMGSLSNSFRNAVDAYGWQNYVPLRGRSLDIDGDDPLFIPNYGDNVFSSQFRAFQGRESLAEDIFDDVQRAATTAIEQYAAQDLIGKVAIHTAAAGNVVDYNTSFEKAPLGGNLLQGTVEQMDINSARFKRLMSQKDVRTLVWYNPRNSEGGPIQNALVIRLDNEEGSAAVLGARSESADRLDQILRIPNVNGVGIHQVTQFTASLKTWRNLPFIPFDALRNLLTLGYTSATEQGLTGLRSYLNVLTEPGMSNYGRDIMRYTRLYVNNDFDTLQTLVTEGGPGSTLAELDTFFRLGGPTSMLASIRDAPPGSIESLSRIPGQGRGRKQLAAMDDMFTSLNLAADTLSRFAFYKALLDQGESPQIAAARAKNTANFEQRGTWTGPLSGLFEFARATAVGATALINSTLTGKYGKETAAVAFGSGVMLYTAMTLFAGTDDEGDDNMGKVNGRLFKNNLVFQYGDENDQRIQFGLGFGPIAASLSAGLQAARFMHGHQSLKNTADNSLSGLIDQYELFPASGISPVDDPLGFAANTAVPSVIKPWFEVWTNLSGLGIPVRSDYPGAESGDMTDSFEGRYTSEQEMYETLTQALSNAGLAEINPDNMRHLMRGYGGAMTYLIESVFENVKYATGDEDFAYNMKAGLYPLRSFIGSTYDQRTQDFYADYGRMQQLNGAIRGFEKRGDEAALARAEAIRNSEFYSSRESLVKQADRALREINEQFGPGLRLGSTSLSTAREYRREREALRQEVFRDYLSDVE